MTRKPLLLFLLFTLCLGCDSARGKHAGGKFSNTPETKQIFEESGNTPETKQIFEESGNKPETKQIFEEADNTPETKYTFEEFEKEFLNPGVLGVPIGTYFWDEFGELEALYGLTEDESKLLGEWMNATFVIGPYYHYYYTYVFYPNKLFLIHFPFMDFRVIEAEEAYFSEAVGTWEIAGGIVRITVYAVVTEDRTKDRPDNNSVFFLEQPYSFDFVNIDDVDGRGFTARPVNGNVLSEELERKVIKEPNMTNNLYVRNVYSDNLVGGGGKIYGYFNIVPEMARENLSGLDVATNPGLIKRYIFGLWP